MSVDEVRSAMNSRVEPFMKSSSSEMATDDFVDAGMHVHYRPPGVCEAVEVFPPANPIFQGHKLVLVRFSEALSYFQQIDPAVEVLDDGLTSRLFGIGLYAPAKEDVPDALVESVIVFEEGYYD